MVKEREGRKEGGWERKGRREIGGREIGGREGEGGGRNEGGREREKEGEEGKEGDRREGGRGREVGMRGRREGEEGAETGEGHFGEQITETCRERVYLFGLSWQPSCPRPALTQCCDTAPSGLEVFLKYNQSLSTSFSLSLTPSMSRCIINMSPNIIYTQRIIFTEI